MTVLQGSGSVFQIKKKIWFLCFKQVLNSNGVCNINKIPNLNIGHLLPLSFPPVNNLNLLMKNSKELWGRGKNSGLEIKMPGQWHQFHCSQQRKNPPGKGPAGEWKGCLSCALRCTRLIPEGRTLSSGTAGWPLSLFRNPISAVPELVCKRKYISFLSAEKTSQFMKFFLRKWGSIPGALWSICKETFALSEALDGCWETLRSPYYLKRSTVNCHCHSTS